MHILRLGKKVQAKGAFGEGFIMFLIPIIIFAKAFSQLLFDFILKTKVFSIIAILAFSLIVNFPLLIVYY